MAYFFETTETIPEGLGFNAYGPLHLTWLLCLAIALAAASVCYKRLDEKGRSSFMKVLAVVIFVSKAV